MANEVSQVGTGNSTQTVKKGTQEQQNTWAEQEKAAVNAELQAGLNGKEFKGDNFNIITINGNNNQVTFGDNSPIINTGNKSPVAVTYGDGSDVNQAVGTHAQVISKYKEFNIDSETAQLLVDAGYTSADDINFIKGKVSDPAFKKLAPENQQKVLKEISDSTKTISELGIESGSAKIMIRSGIGIGKSKNLDIAAIKDLVAQDEFQNLSPEEQKILCDNIKFPEAIKSVVVDGEFNSIELGPNGTVKMSSTEHGYELTLKTDDDTKLQDLRTAHRVSVSYAQNTGKPLYYNERFDINSANGELVYRDNPEDQTHNGKPWLRDVYISECGEGSEKFKITNTTQNSITYTPLAQKNRGKIGAAPCNNSLVITTYNKGGVRPDKVKFVRAFEERQSRYSDNRPSADFIYRDCQELLEYNLKDAGRTYNCRTISEWRGKHGKNLANAGNDTYIHSNLIFDFGLKPDKETILPYVRL